MTTKKIYLAEPLGFCGGVRRAMEMFQQTRREHPNDTIYILHELVHNNTVTNEIRNSNACIINSLDEAPNNAVTLFGAHGIGKSVEMEAQKRGLHYHDAVCPLVAQLQNVAAKEDADVPLILFGDKEHPEVKSVLDRAAAKQIFVLGRQEDIDTLPTMNRALLLCQTTRNADEVKAVAAKLKQRIPLLNDQAKVCDAVSRRQHAVAELASKCDLFLIVGSTHSSNGRRMLAIAEAKCARAIMLDNADSIDEEMLQNVNAIGIGAATSTPDSAINAIIDKLKSFNFTI